MLEPPRHHNTVSRWLAKPLNSSLLIFVTALVFRLLVLLALHESPYWSNHLVDAELYDGWASALAEGTDPHPAPYFYSPVYPWAISLLYRLFGHSLTAVRLIQCVLGALLCVLVNLFARRLLSWQASLCAGLLCALFGLLAFYDNLILKTAPVTFLVLAGVWLLQIKPKGKSLSQLCVLLSGAALGLAADLRGNAALVALAVLVFVLVEALRNRRYFSPVLLCIGLAVSVLPLTFANCAASGEFVPTTYSGGFNFYEGNSAEATGYHPALSSVRQSAAHEHSDAVAAVRKALGREPSPPEVSGYWSARAWRDIGRNPGRWIRLLAFKTALLFNHVEIPDNYNYGFMSERLSPLRSSPVTFFLLIPFAICGLGIAIARGGQWRLTVLVVLVYGGSVVLFYVTSRYRAPLAPFFAILSALAVEQVLKWVASRDFQRALVFCVAIFALFVAAAKPLVSEELGFGREYYALGNMEFQRGDYDRAIENYISATEYHPASAQLENNLGAAYVQKAKRRERDCSSLLGFAVIHLERAVELRPDYFEAWKNLGLAHVQTGDNRGAIEALRRALFLAPDYDRHRRTSLILQSISQ